jgi:2-O-methyltransferase
VFYLSLFLLVFLLNIQSGYGYYLERRYEGLNALWKAAEDVESRLLIVGEFIPENPTIFEAGAYDGNESVKMAQHWPQGRIIAFEPNPNIFARFQEKTFGFENIVGYPLAVNTYDGGAKFYLCRGSSGTETIYEGASSLLKFVKHREADCEGPVINVSCVVLDHWCEENEVEAIDFMWLDLEGFEMQFLKSSPKILDTVKVIYTETNHQKLREGMTQFKELNSFLETKGFRVIAHWFNEGYQGDAIFVRYPG